jgi:transcriptional regulator with XRE-family HTH domain
MYPGRMSDKALINRAMADVIRSARTLQRRTVIETAELSGITKFTLMRLEKGERDINVTQLTQLAPVLGASPEALMRRAVDRLAELEAAGEQQEQTSDAQANVLNIEDKRFRNMTAADIDAYHEGSGLGKAALHDPEMDTDEDGPY